MELQQIINNLIHTIHNDKETMKMTLNVAQNISFKGVKIISLKCRRRGGASNEFPRV